MKKMHAPKIMVCSIAILSVAGCGGGCVGGGAASGGQTYSTEGTIDTRQALGFADGGQPLTWDKAYTADLTGDGRDELLVYTSFDYLDQQDPSPYVVFGQRDGEF
ncbi:MAG TPA: hypothetical protein DIW16_08730, partial [Marinobacter hydrocarbonoclasticus]|nr:hypothetical protein [Marinobacter nauticus]